MLIMVISVMLAFNASALNENNKGQNVNKSKYLKLKPLPKPELDFEKILKLNLARDLDIYDVYAWSKVYKNQSESSQEMINYISKKLSSDELKVAGKRYEQLVKNINDGKFTHNLMFPSRLLFKSNNIEYEIIPSKAIAPTYPRIALIAKIQGYVNLMFSVYQDGSTRDIIVLSEYPKRIFTKAAIKAISQYRFKIKWKDETVHSDYKQLTTQRVDFKLKGNFPFILTERIQNLSEQLELAKQGDLIAQHKFTNSYKSLPVQFNTQVIKSEQVNIWLFDLARKGYKDSQYYLGQAIYSGNGCLEEPQKGFDWIVMAAQNNNVDAQNDLYGLIQSSKIQNTSGHPAIYWLEKAAQNGSIDAKLKIAKNTANSDVIDKEELIQALGYIENYASSYGRLPQYYQVKALLLSKQGHKSKAKIAIKTAIKLAKRAGWDISLLKQQHKMIRKS